MPTEKLAELRIELLKILLDAGMPLSELASLIASCYQSMMVAKLKECQEVLSWVESTHSRK